MDALKRALRRLFYPGAAAVLLCAAAAAALLVYVFTAGEKNSWRDIWKITIKSRGT